MTRAADDDASPGNGLVRAIASAMVLLLASCAVTACDAQGSSGADGDATRTSPAAAGPAASTASSTVSAPAPTASVSPSSTATGGPLTLAELVSRPCRAIDDEDARPAKLGIFTEGTETDYDAKSCQWGARGGLVSFTPYASKDQTRAEEFQHLTRKNIGGHRALLGSITDHGRETYVLLVSVGKNQSFRLMVLPPVEDTPGPDAPTLATAFAETILSHLR
ncbi:DUF3558 family protein [Streptomyces sp. NPDC051243]|uniref:DUF3558 family protein n=1 Tax=Streptomyces sp. NPDC051243 TaxID=3365646 RepID=UPI0037927719